MTPTTFPIQAIRTNCSIADIYVSYTNPRPNAAIYAEKLSAAVNKPAFLTMEGQAPGKPVYVTVVGTRLPSTTAQLASCLDFTYEFKLESITRE